MIWTYDSGGGEDYSSLSTWEADTDIVITSANNVVVVSHDGLTGSIGNGDNVTGATSTATGTVVGVVPDRQICIDVTTGDFQNGEQIYKTINVDYVTSSSAEDTLGIMYLDCYDGPHDDYVNLAGATTDSNHYRCIRSASDCTTPFAGKREAGAYFETIHTDAVFTLTENYCRIEHIGAKLSTSSPSDERVFYVVGNNCKVIGCVMYDSSSSASAVVHGIEMQGNGGLVVNCIAHDNTGAGFRLTAGSGESNYAYNCTAVDNGEDGFEERSSGNNYVWNCVGDNNTSNDFDSGFSSSSDYNMSGDTSAPGAHNKTSKSFTNMWASETSGSEDYHLSATGEADSDFQGGADPSGALNPPDYTLSHDIDEQERDTWYRGADEYNLRLYVWSGGSDVAPYISWATAAHSIQDAIDAASSGNIVTVRAGTYNENITMADGVDVENRPGDRPIIDGAGSVVVTFNGDFSTACTLDGFEVEDGASDGLIYLHGTGAGIDNNTAVTNCYVHGNNSGPGIKIDGSTATTAPTIDYCQIYSNSQEGIYIIDGGSSSEDLVIQYNAIHDHTSKAGINIGGDSYVTIGPENDIYDNYSGIAFDTGDPSSKPITILANHIHSKTYGQNEGIVVEDAVTNAETITITENEIDDHVYGGIQILNSCKLEITKNDIHENLRGGIHTGTQAADPGGFSGTAGSAVLTIRENKVWGNGQTSYGGGIDVRHADGTIYNNLVYRNRRGGIRFGDWIDEIINNTVAYNGNATDDMGGGIIYDDISEGDAVNAKPAGDPPAVLEIKNNICAYNQKAGIRACFANTLGSEERDYNLVYFNNGETDNCGGSGNFRMSCLNKQFGECGGIWNDSPPPYVILDGPYNIVAYPDFEDKDNDDYRLKSTSPGVDAGDTSYGTDKSIPPGVGTAKIDMGAYGGPYGIDW